MDNYYQDGYTPPSGVTSSEQVAAMQEKLNAAGAEIAVDGVWGADTQSAYDTYGSTLADGTQTPTTTQFGNDDFQTIYDSIYSSYPNESEIQAEIEAYLRPQYDKQIKEQEQQRIENNAAIDVDAASRGMTPSTWVTDAKLQQLKSESANVASLESDYAGQLYSALSERKDADEAEAYDRALDMWQIEQASGSGDGDGDRPPADTVTITLPDGTTFTGTEAECAAALAEYWAAHPVQKPTTVTSNPAGSGSGKPNVNMVQ